MVDNQIPNTQAFSEKMATKQRVAFICPNMRWDMVPWSIKQVTDLRPNAKLRETEQNRFWCGYRVRQIREGGVSKMVIGGERAHKDGCHADAPPNGKNPLGYRVKSPPGAFQLDAVWERCPGRCQSERCHHTAFRSAPKTPRGGRVLPMFQSLAGACHTPWCKGIAEGSCVPWSLVQQNTSLDRRFNKYLLQHTGLSPSRKMQVASVRIAHAVALPR